jgi:hypothetical protein
MTKKQYRTELDKVWRAINKLGDVLVAKQVIDSNPMVEAIDEKDMLNALLELTEAGEQAVGDVYAD